MKKWWKELIDKPLLKAFLHYYQASDSELTSVAVAYYWLISIFPCFWWWSISSLIFRFLWENFWAL